MSEKNQSACKRKLIAGCTPPHLYTASSLLSFCFFFIETENHCARVRIARGNGSVDELYHVIPQPGRCRANKQSTITNDLANALLSKSKNAISFANAMITRHEDAKSTGGPSGVCALASSCPTTP